MQINTVEQAELKSALNKARVTGVSVDIVGLEKQYGERHVLRGLDLRLRHGEFVAIIGRSGCGKSTLLRLAAALDTASGGTIEIDGQRQTKLHPDTRIMFQDARLLPWKRVADNVALGLDTAPRYRAREVLFQVGLEDRARDWPAVLSGGQRQRVALARALVHQPRLLLLDEPLGALDALTRIEMQSLIEVVWLRHGFTALLVTHDVGEAIAVADRVVLIDEGRVVLDLSVDMPRPRSRGTAAFAALEDKLLQRVLRQPGAAATTHPRL